MGWVEGKIWTFDLRAAQRALDRLPDIASEIVRSEVVDVIAVIRAVTVSAVRRATPTIPDCVFKCEC